MKKLVVLALVFIPFLAFSLPKKPAKQFHSNQYPEHGITFNQDSMAYYVLKYVNEYRAEYGLHPYILDTNLCITAINHSVYMAHEGYFGHDEPNYKSKYFTGHDNGERGSAAENAAGSFWYAYSEYFPSDKSTHQKIAREVVNMWILSPGHRENLIDPGNTRMGYGMALKEPTWSEVRQAYDAVIYHTQTFY